jgi:hypothetical protein
MFSYICQIFSYAQLTQLIFDVFVFGEFRSVIQNCSEPVLRELPPLNITVDYGDGSGSNMWQRTNKIVIWSHVYTRPGKFVIGVHCKYRIAR